ncbi:unnamed protein product, partial [Ixodes hexagonus]
KAKQYYDKRSTALHDVILGLITNETATKILAGGGNDSMLAVYLVDSSVLPTMLVIWSLACGTVAAGALWSGSTRKLLYVTQHRNMFKPQKKEEENEADPLEPASAQEPVVIKPPEKTSKKSLAAPSEEQLRPQTQNGKDKADTAFGDSDEKLQLLEEEFMFSECPIDCQLLILLVTVLAVNLLLLYYFFSQLLIVLLICIFIGSVVSLVVIFDALSFPMACISVRLPNLLCPCFVQSMELRHHVVLLGALGLPVIWVIYMKHQHAWILQNILGMSFAINIIRCMHLPHFKVITTSSILLFFYDIFMVFVTGYLQKGESVMEAVANEVQQLPVLMRVPRLMAGELAVCESQYSILGYGDMIIPGFAVAYCRCFDILVKDNSLYFFLSMACYSVSLVVAFSASIMMSMGQPALLYLVPGTLLPVIIAAWCRGDFQDFWTGKFKPKGSLQTRMNIWASSSEQFQMIQGRGLLYVSTPVIEWIAVPLPVSQKAYNAKWS